MGVVLEQQELEKNAPSPNELACGRANNPVILARQGVVGGLNKSLFKSNLNSK